MSEYTFKATLTKKPIAKKSDNWRDTAYQWIILINDQSFDYYTGSGLVNKNMTPKEPTLDDVLYSLISDSEACEMSFNDWCDNFGYETDSRHALETYLLCQENATKLRKAKVDINKERERLQDY